MANYADSWGGDAESPSCGNLCRLVAYVDRLPMSTVGLNAQSVDQMDTSTGVDLMWCRNEEYSAAKCRLADRGMN